MTRLDDYLRAERPDTTEPVSFYVPGARSWSETRKGLHQPPKEAADAEELGAGRQEDVDELAAAKLAAAITQTEADV